MEIPSSRGEAYGCSPGVQELGLIMFGYHIKEWGLGMFVNNEQENLLGMFASTYSWQCWEHRSARPEGREPNAWSTHRSGTPCKKEVQCQGHPVTRRYRSGTGHGHSVSRRCRSGTSLKRRCRSGTPCNRRDRSRTPCYKDIQVRITCFKKIQVRDTFKKEMQVRGHHLTGETGQECPVTRIYRSGTPNNI